VPLDPRLRDHALKGEFSGRRECHVEPDWLLFYKRGPGVIIFERTGTHADLFEVPASGLEKQVLWSEKISCRGLQSGGKFIKNKPKMG
jgi:mRNA interferase YafQ